MSKQKNTQSHPISTDVRLLPLPFYDMLVTLMKPSSLLAPQKGLAASTFTFNLSPSNVQEISRNRYAENGNIQHTVQIQLRFCLCDTSKEQPDCYPSSEFQVVVNNKEIQLPPPLPTRPGQPLKRPHLPLDITAQAKISPTASNSKSILLPYSSHDLTLKSILKRSSTHFFCPFSKLSLLFPSSYRNYRSLEA